MTVDYKYVLQDGASLPKQYELQGGSGSTPLSQKTEQDNAAYAAIEMQRRESEVARWRSDVIQALYAMQGEILSRWIQDGALGDPSSVLSWSECEAQADKLIDEAKQGGSLPDNVSLDPSVVNKIYLAAGREPPKPKANPSIDPRYELKNGDKDPNYTLIDPVTTRPEISLSAAGKAAKKVFTLVAQTKPKETLAGINHEK